MTDTILIQNGVAHEVFTDRTIKDMTSRRHPDLVAQMVEVDGGVTIGDVWDGRAFTKPVQPPDPPRPRDPLAEIDALRLEVDAIKATRIR